MQHRFEIQAVAEHTKMRLEDFLLDQFSSLSKMYLREVVKNSHCEVNGRLENIGYRLRADDFVEIVVDQTRGTSMRPENIALAVVFEDTDLIVVNKPAGMLVHPSHRENSGTLLNALVYHLNKEILAGTRGASGELAFPLANAGNGVKPSANRERIQSDSPRASETLGLQSFIRPGLPHRLDKQTSGLLVVAKNARAHRILSGHFMKKRVEKLYLALVEGIVACDEGTITAPIGRYDELKYWGVKASGKHSESRFTVRERFFDSTLLELEPVTGRTNQLRIHCELIGHPIVGDVGRGGREFERLCLHAYKLGFPHPITQEGIQFELSATFALSINDRIDRTLAS